VAEQVYAEVGLLKLFGLSLACGLVCVGAELDAVGYGKYLMDEVGLSHAARSDVELDRSKWLTGAMPDPSRSCESKNGIKVALECNVVRAGCSWNGVSEE